MCGDYSVQGGSTVYLSSSQILAIAVPHIPVGLAVTFTSFGWPLLQTISIQVLGLSFLKLKHLLFLHGPSFSPPTAESDFELYYFVNGISIFTS